MFLFSIALKLLLVSSVLAYTSDNYTAEPDPYYGQSPPVYPSPASIGSSNARWTAAYAKANLLVSQMTLEEKVNVTHGFTGICVGNTGAVPRLGWQSLCLSDAPDGLRGQEFTSSFPAGIHLAATFDRNLMHQYGLALGAEFRGKGVNMALGPVAGPLGRVARGGRNWEGLSNDPYLAGVGTGLITRGTQEAGTIACPKHFLMNEQEERRRPQLGQGEALSSNLDDRTLHELYAFPFMNALREGAGAVMCSYNRVNNSYGCQNSKLLNGILKTEWGFEGLVVSDWDAQHSGVGSANAGLDLVMPDSGFWGGNLTEAVKNGSVTMDRLEDMALRQLAVYYYIGQDTPDYPPHSIFSSTQKHLEVNVQQDHTELIRQIGAAGTVLVKNVNKTLPFQNPRFLNVYGYDAVVKATPWQNPSRFGGGYEVNFGWDTLNGTLITAGGSGSNTPAFVIDPFHAINERLSKVRGTVRWDFWSENPTPAYVNAEACLVFINAYASESFDRTSLTDEFSDNLVRNVAANCTSTIVVIHSAGIRVVDAWVENPNVTAVLFAGLPGQETGHAITDVLWGDLNPSGRLPYTVAKQESDYGRLLNSTTSTEAYPQDNFTEGLYIDYRAFDKSGIEPRYEFGFGLSYTTFEYADLSTSDNLEADTGPYPDPSIAIIQGGHPQLWDELFNVTFTVTNSGDLPGYEIPQLYLGIPNSPARQLRGFDRISIQAGDTQSVTFTLTRRDLSIWDVIEQQWHLQSGSYDFMVGASSRDSRLTGTINI